MTEFSDCSPTAAFEKPSKLIRMILLRHAKCDKSDNKYDSYSDEENECDTSDDDSLPSLCSDSDPDDMDQQEFDDIELQLMYGKIEDDDPILQDETEVGDTDHEKLKKLSKLWRTMLRSREPQLNSSRGFVSSLSPTAILTDCV
jgi:hypothetical protein